MKQSSQVKYYGICKRKSTLGLLNAYLGHWRFPLLQCHVIKSWGESWLAKESFLCGHQHEKKKW